MDMLDWITLAIFFGLGLWVGCRVTAAVDRAVFKSLLEELGIGNKQLIALAKKHGMDLPGVVHVEAADDLEEIEIKLEQHSGVIYAFRKDNDQFLGQGENREQLLDRLKEKLQKVRLIISQEDGAQLIREPEKNG